MSNLDAALMTKANPIPTTTTTPGDRTTGPLRRPLVLVADDDPIQRLSLVRILEQDGYDVIQAEDGRGAVALADAHDIDFAVVDVVMPGMSGLEAIAAIRSRPHLATIPAIIVSGLEDVDTHVTALAVGADDFILKPFDPRELRARIGAQNRIVRAWGDRVGSVVRAMAAEVTETCRVVLPGSVPTRAPDPSLDDWIAGVTRDRAFDFVYQPIVELQTGRIVGQEALARFDDGTSPGEVFGVAETRGRSSELELALVETALERTVALPEGVRLHVNVSPTTALTDELRELVGRSNRRVVLEITENALFGSSSAAALRRSIPASCLLAADDVGAGYAGLSQLLEFRPDILKIDRAVVAGIDRDPARQALAAGLVAYAQATRSFVVGEGIERQEEWDSLAELGVDFGQGYLIAKPAPLSAVDPLSLERPWTTAHA